jgi:hypothetical protein
MAGTVKRWEVDDEVKNIAFRHLVREAITTTTLFEDPRDFILCGRMRHYWYAEEDFHAFVEEHRERVNRISAMFLKLIEELTVD